jgi:hypothetical protein
MSRPLPLAAVDAPRWDDRRCGVDRRRGDRRGAIAWRAEEWAASNPSTERRHGDRRHAIRRERPVAILTYEQAQRATLAQAYASLQDIDP